MSALDRCQVCGSHELTAFYEVRDVPTQSTVLLESESEARDFPSGDIELASCSGCGFVQNNRFEPGSIDYSLPTEESQAFSPLFAQYANALADRLVADHDLVGGSVLEVGSGKGEFLAILADRGIAHGVGIDPGFLPDRGPSQRANLEFKRDFFGPGAVDLTGDLVVTRHVLEHISDVSGFSRLLARAVSATSDSSLFVEVPDARRIFEEGAFWDIYYEHCSYFTSESLAAALRVAGMSVDRVEAGFESQYLLAWASSGFGGSGSGSANARLEAIESLVENFAAAANTSAERWRSRIERELEAGREVVVWGASSKAVGFLSAVGVADVTLIDINPFKQGKWLPGSGLVVKAPSDLAGSKPGLVVPMNPIYVEEIRADLRQMGLDPPIEAVG